jgi:hypothetical protein
VFLWCELVEERRRLIQEESAEFIGFQTRQSRRVAFCCSDEIGGCFSDIELPSYLI